MITRGFTLIEILVTLALSTVAIVTISEFTRDITDFGVSLNARLDTERESELVLRTILTEIRSMGAAANGAYTIAAASPTSLTFYSDVDNDSVNEQVRYYLSGSTLLRGVTEPSGTPATYPASQEVSREVVHYLTNTSQIFRYYPEGDYTVTGPLSSPITVGSVRMIETILTTDRDTTRPPLASTLSVFAMIRNLRGEI